VEPLIALIRSKWLFTTLIPLLLICSWSLRDCDGEISDGTIFLQDEWLGETSSSLLSSLHERF
jgi:hypothetical protein